MKPLLDALLTVVIFWLFVGVLVTAPTWGRWLDAMGEDEAWERAVAERYADLYERIRAGSER